MIVEITDVEGLEMLVSVATPIGRIEIFGQVRLSDGWLVIERAHVQGLAPGALGRQGLNVIARKLMVEADAQGIVVEGSTRTTGRTRGRRPRPFRFPLPPPAESGR
ncbi:hypothetical protein [Methylobacterium oxalidis]|uniref:hypothetical protein n=1 Tax=Methylobacterium oxalidis TaxID=944322 RepID=UPI0033152F89